VDLTELHGDNINLATAVNSIGEGIDRAVNTSMKDEKLKADLITNVSHDIKTPLTSIINYVDLIKREDIDNERVNEYVDILDRKSQKLKQLTEDLVEASKISSGNISIQLSKINFVELVNQTIGEFYEKLEKNDLQVIFKPQMQNMQIYADARHLWRVIENLLNNVCKYALEGTRVYIDMQERKEIDKMVVFSIKNISAKELNVDADELTERFIRGDESRATEGSGLGLSIAKNLTLAQNGTFDIRLDGDLFKVIIKFRAVD
jgi:signal transduction histidine kinase